MRYTAIASSTLLLMLFLLPVSEGGGLSEVNEIPLSKHLRRLLSAEMNAVQNGMSNLSIAVPAGHWSDISKTAKIMNQGYLMKKKLSKKQWEEFYRSLPPGYREIDREFHKAAGLLEKAAGEQDVEGVNAYVCRLNESCVKCHSKYAKKRFSGFKKIIQ